MPPAACIFTLDTKSGFRDVVFVTGVLRPRRKYRAGPRRSRRVLRPQADLPRGLPRVLRRALGRKQQRLVYARRSRPAHDNVETSTGRPGALLHRATPTCSNSPTTRSASRITIQQRAGHPMPMDIEWAKDGERWPALHRSGPAGDGGVRSAAGRLRELCARRPAARSWSTGRAVGEKIATGTVRVDRRARRSRGLPGPARCWLPRPRARIGSR